MSQEPIKEGVAKQGTDKVTIERIIEEHDCEAILRDFEVYKGGGVTATLVKLKRGNTERSVGKLADLEALSENEVRGRVVEAVARLPRPALRNAKLVSLDTAWLL